ncbi:BnaA09g15010D [Brassica napus]|uniref:BnaA09g15010D protein n=1 Tax=Brassica napus TaxID=3708 RepID=A0A078HRM0_BRANA|nr:BnaA09g15010D [Brassica napus]
MELMNLTSNVKQIQDDVLKEILTLNANTEYLRGYLHGSSDKELFKKNVPVVSYDDVKPYIQRVTSGEPSNVISGKPITRFLLSSGTSGGKQKIFPVNNKFFEDMAFIYALRSFLISKHTEGDEKGKVVMLFFAREQSISPCGLPISTSRDEVVAVAASFASSLVGAITFLESYWKEICNNIRSGHVSEWITDLSCRDAVTNILGGGNSELADKIEEECKKKSWKCIIPRLWPNVKFIQSIVTGQNSQYIPMLEFYSNKVHLFSPAYGSSETMFGVNVNPLCKPEDVSYTFMPNISYFEFILADKGNEGEIVDLVNVEIGSYYEPLITNYYGLHRYRMGDILQVTGFYNNAPQFRFVGRKKLVLSVNLEVTTEEDILKALNNATLVLQRSDLLLMGFTSYADISTLPGHYIFYWELKAKNISDIVKPDNKVLVECCCVMEESLSALYREIRSKDGSIGPLEIRIVQQGTFNSLMEFSISQGASPSQYKTPMCIKSSEALVVLDNNVLARFFSDKSPPF